MSGGMFNSLQFFAGAHPGAQSCSRDAQSEKQLIKKVRGLGRFEEILDKFWLAQRHSSRETLILFFML